MSKNRIYIIKLIHSNMCIWDRVRREETPTEQLNCSYYSPFSGNLDGLYHMADMNSLRL